jgi:hypothetical protein
MNSTFPDSSIIAAVGEGIYWGSIVLLVSASLVLSFITTRSPKRVLVYVAAGTLALALLMASLPGPNSPTFVAVILGVVTVALATVGGGPAVQVVLVLATRGSLANGFYGGILVADRDPASGVSTTHEILRGGTTIGYLERLATAGAIVAGFPAAIAVLVAIKSVGRFSELDVAEARERFIIGTLVSLIWAAACAGVFYLATT